MAERVLPNRILTSRITFTKPVSGVQLLSGIVGTVDVGGLIAKAVEISKETENTKTILDRLQKYIDAQKSVYVAWWKNWASTDYEKFKNDVESAFYSNVKLAASDARDQAMLSALGYGATAAMRGLESKIWQAFSGLDVMADMVYGIPQRIAYEKAERYWNQKIAPNVPDSQLAFQMYMKGRISRAEFNQYCAWEGWDSFWHDRLYDVYSRDPDEYMAFSMWRRGLIKDDVMLKCFKSRGWDEKWHPILTQYLFRIPTAYDLMRMADYTPLEPIWVAEMLRKNGYDDETVLRMVEVIQKRPLREEVRNVAGRYAWDYENGRIPLDKLKENLGKLGLLPLEKDLWVLWSELRYADTLLEKSINIILYRFRKRWYDTKEEVITELKNLNIREEMANLMAEEWYWQYRAPYYNYLTIQAVDNCTTNPPAGKYRYPEGTKVTVTASPRGGYVFDHWEYNGYTSTQNPITLTMDAYYTLKPVVVYG